MQTTTFTKGTGKSNRPALLNNLKAWFKQGYKSSPKVKSCATAVATIEQGKDIVLSDELGRSVKICKGDDASLPYDYVYFNETVVRNPNRVETTNKQTLRGY